MNSTKRELLSIFTLLALFGFAPTPVKAERLPVKIYTSADGLGSGFVDFLYRDSRGFMWFCTRDGLSRFDGSRFVTFQIGDKQASPGIENIFETREGKYYIATTGGTYRFDPEALSEPIDGIPSLNAEYITPARGFFVQTHDGTIWLGSDELLRLQQIDGRESFVSEPIGIPENEKTTFVIYDLAEANDNSLWIHSSWGLVRRLPDGRTVFYPYERAITGGNTAMLVDRTGKVWLSRGTEVLVMRPESIDSITESGPIVYRDLLKRQRVEISSGKDLVYPRSGGEIIEFLNRELIGRWAAKRMFQTADGDVWIAAENLLLQFSSRSLTVHTDLEGLPTALARMAEDEAGNLWIGGHSGLARLNRNGLITFGKEDGLTSARFFSVNEDAEGKLYFAQSGYYWTSFDGVRFETARPNLEENTTGMWTSRFGFLSTDGDLWFLSTTGVYRFSNGRDVQRLRGRRPDRTYTTADGLKSDSTFQIFEDSSGDIWVSTRGLGAVGHGIARLKKGADGFVSFGIDDGLPPAKSAASYIEDQFENIWIGFYEGGLARYDGERFQVFGPEHGLPTSGHISDLLIDYKGRLWLTSSTQGLFLVGNSNSKVPSFDRVTVAPGNISNNIRTITEDRFGRLYLGTARGVQRYSPETGHLKNYSVLDGLASDFVVDSHRDRRGDLWFVTNNGISRLTPLPEERNAAPRVFISGIRVAGAPQPISKLGNSVVEKGELEYYQNNLQIEYLGLDFRAGESLQFQYKLEGADEDWSLPSESRSITFANLRPASYRFLVRAVNAEGQISDTPASVSFVIVAPIWQRGWFILFLTIVIAGLTILIFRYRTANLREINEALREAKRAEERLRKAREERLAELEKVRQRIATDLHDDIGASLTQIAILSEVAQAKSGESNGDSDHPLAKITEVSNQLVGTMSDIVWSINPTKDHLSDLVQRMRRFAADVFSTKEIEFQFLAPTESGETIVSSNIRREVFLIFKETVNNVLKHSGAKRVRIEIAVERGELVYRIADDGIGFDPDHPTPSSGGHGISGMKDRVNDLGGKLQFISEPGQGTTVSLSLPLSEIAAAQN